MSSRLSLSSASLSSAVDGQPSREAAVRRVWRYRRPRRFSHGPLASSAAPTQPSRPTCARTTPPTCSPRRAYLVARARQHRSGCFIVEESRAHLLPQHRADHLTRIAVIGAKKPRIGLDLIAKDGCRLAGISRAAQMLKNQAQVIDGGQVFLTDAKQFPQADADQTGAQKLSTGWPSPRSIAGERAASSSASRSPVCSWDLCPCRRLVLMGGSGCNRLVLARCSSDIHASQATHRCMLLRFQRTYFIMLGAPRRSHSLAHRSATASRSPV